MKQVRNTEMFAASSDGDILCVTTNGVVRKNGCLVMGAGVAKAFRDSFSGCDKRLGDLVSKYGNKVYYIGKATINTKQVHLVSFPTKNDWQDKSSVDLIRNSCIQLKQLIHDMELHGKVYLPKPGCNNGGLNWENDVAPIIESYLSDEKYIICEPAYPRMFVPNAQLLPLKETMSQPVEAPSKKDILFSKIEQIEDFSDKIGELVFDEINKDDNSTTEMGSYILHTLRSCQTDRELEIANDMLTAVCGWGIETLIKKNTKA